MRGNQNCGCVYPCVNLCVWILVCDIVRVHAVKSILWVCVSLCELVGVYLSVTLWHAMQSKLWVCVSQCDIVRVQAVQSK